LIASAGGHWIELVRFSPALKEHECLFISTSKGLKPPLGEHPVLQIADGSRDTLYLLAKSVFDIYRSLRMFCPDVIITTGAAPGATALLVGKLLGAVTIWIDSIANSEELSLSGKVAKYFADLRLTQWEHLASDRDHVGYMGGVL
jgi:UDP-N-acetylglucosamine:LPS N-acetylglucosamine transferase